MKEKLTPKTESINDEATDKEAINSVSEAEVDANATSEASSPQTQPETNVQNAGVDDPKAARKKRIAKILFTALFVAIIVAIIVFTAVNDFSSEDVSFDKVGEMIGENWYYLLVLLGLFAATILAETFKFFIMIRKTTHRYMFGTAFKCASLGKFYDFVTPFGTGGQPFQIYYLSKSGVPSGPAGAIPIGSMFLIQLSFFVCAIVSFIVGVNPQIVPVYIQILAYFGSVCYIIVSLFLVVFSFIPKAGYKVIRWGVKVLTKLRICKSPEKWIAKGNRAIDNNKTNMGILLQSKRVLIVGTLLSFVFNIALCSMPYFTLLLFPSALEAAGWTPSWSLWFEVLRITFFIYCAVTIIPTPGNSGAADGTFYGLFRSVLATIAGASFTCMMVWRIFSFYSFVLLGVIVTIVLKIIGLVRARRSKKLNLSEDK